MYSQMTMYKKLLQQALFSLFLINLSLAAHAEADASVNDTGIEDPNTTAAEIDANIESLDKYDWTLVRDMSDIQIYMKHRDESKIKSFLGKTIMEVHDLYSLAAVIEDFEAAPEWMHMMSEVTELKRITNNHREVRLETRLPWPVKDRDTTIDAHVFQDPENYDITITMTQNDELLPEYPGYIRMPEIRGIIRSQMLSNQRMAVEMEFLLDPGGYIPPWLNNIILKDISFHTLKKLRKMLLKEKYQNKKSVYESWLSMPENYTEGDYKHPKEEQILEDHKQKAIPSA